MGMDVLKIVAGLVGLIVGGEWLLRAAVGTSNRFAIPKFIIGMTVVSFATSLPELIVSVRSALAGYPDLALGNLAGGHLRKEIFPRLRWLTPVASGKLR